MNDDEQTEDDELLCDDAARQDMDALWDVPECPFTDLQEEIF